MRPADPLIHFKHARPREAASKAIEAPPIWDIGGTTSVHFDDDLGWADWVDAMADRGRGDVTGDDKRHICGACFDDDGLRCAITNLGVSKKCDFCGRRYRSAKAAPVTEAAAYIRGALPKTMTSPKTFYSTIQKATMAGPARPTISGRTSRSMSLRNGMRSRLFAMLSPMIVRGARAIPASGCRGDSSAKAGRVLAAM